MAKRHSHQVLAGNIEWLAEVQGLSIQRVCGMADISRQTYYKWKRGEQEPTLLNLENVAHALGLRNFTDLFLRPPELWNKVEEEGLVEFRFARPVITANKRPRLASAPSSPGRRRKRAGTV